MVKETDYFIKDASYILRKLKDRKYVASNSYFVFFDIKQFYINIQNAQRRKAVKQHSKIISN